MPYFLSCPICKNSLMPSNTGMTCIQNHSFDRARQGYLNLLPSHRKRSADPGDNKLMVSARNRFLDLRCYQKPAEQLADNAHQLITTSGDDTPAILDAGCGEGYYTTLIQKRTHTETCGLDISKNAIQACCRRSKDITWLVASVSDMPVADNGMNIIVSVFSRIDWREFCRVLKSGGSLLVLAPGQDHLLALRQAIYGEVRPYETDKLLKTLPETIQLESVTAIQDQFLLSSQSAIQDLLAMTPHYWHIKSEQRQRLKQLETLECALDMQLYHFSYQP